MQTELFKNQVYSFTLKGWKSTKRISCLMFPRERVEMAMRRIGQKRKSSSRGSYEKSSGIRRVEKLCSGEAQKAKQVRTDELSIQEKESESTVNQLTVQIQVLQDRVNSPNDSRRFYDPATASSSGSIPRFRVMSVPCLCGMLSRACSLTHGTYMVYRETFFEHLPAPICTDSSLLWKFNKYCIGTMRARVSELRKICCTSG